MSQNLQQNRGLVESVFNNVYDKYDLMNDIMSLGAHRSWKKKLVKVKNTYILKHNNDNYNILEILINS